MDIGVGTGYYIRQASLAGAINSESKVALVDLNPNTLEKAKSQLEGSAAEVRTLEWDVLKPLPSSLEGEISPSSSSKFDSISLFYLFHCLPGPCSSKVRIFSHLKSNLSPDGVLYGATVLGDGNGVCHNLLGKCMIWLYNWCGIFGNRDDSEVVIVRALRENFERVRTSVLGVVLLFAAEGPIL